MHGFCMLFLPLVCLYYWYLYFESLLFFLVPPLFFSPSSFVDTIMSPSLHFFFNGKKVCISIRVYVYFFTVFFPLKTKMQGSLTCIFDGKWLVKIPLPVTVFFWKGKRSWADAQQQIFRTRAESQRIVAARPLCRLQYSVRAKSSTKDLPHWRVELSCLALEQAV